MIFFGRLENIFGKFSYFHKKSSKIEEKMYWKRKIVKIFACGGLQIDF